jgi:hypothetical protein
MKLCDDTSDPELTTSGTTMDEPQHAKPNAGKERPMRAGDRINGELPKCKKSSADIKLPIRAQL